jgi:hypothetical protein
MAIEESFVDPQLGGNYSVVEGLSNDIFSVGRTEQFFVNLY